MSTKKSRRKKSRQKKIILFIIEMVVLVMLLVGLFIYTKASKLNHTGDLDPEELDINKLDSETAEILKGYTNIALFGLDNRTTGNYNGGNSDCIMIASINNDTHEVKIISVYRDTYLNVYDDSYKKMNSAFAKGGAKSSISALNKNLDLNITDYVAVDFNAIVDAVDLLDGIELTLTDEEVKIMNDNYIDEINQVTEHDSSKLSGGGTYTVDGVQALAYTRIRYTAGDDFKRTERQRTVLTEMIAKAKKASVSTINSMIDEMFPEIDTSLSTKELLSIAANVMDYSVEGTQGWPFELCTGTYGSKGSLVVPTDLVTNVSELHKYLFGGEAYTASNTVTAISNKIINDTGCTKDSATRKNNPVTGDDNTATTDTGYSTEVDDGTSGTEKE